MVTRMVILSLSLTIVTIVIPLVTKMNKGALLTLSVVLHLI